MGRFIRDLESKNELIRITQFVDPVLEITEITDRVVKSGGKALLFENTGTRFPVLINAFGSENRMAMALGRKNLDDAGQEIENLFNNLTHRKETFFKKLSSLPQIFNIAGFFPSHSRKKGIMSGTDLHEA